MLAVHMAPQSSSSILACTLPTMGSMNNAHSEIQLDSWHHEQDQQYIPPDCLVIILIILSQEDLPCLITIMFHQNLLGSQSLCILFFKYHLSLLSKASPTE